MANPSVANAVRPLWLPLAVLAIGSAGPAAAAEPLADLPMNHDPDIAVATVARTFPQGMLDRWLTALDRPDADTRYRAAASIAEAHERNVPGLEAAIPALTRELDRTDQHPAVRLAAARALATLDARAAAASLLKQAETGTPALREIVEPALAKWDYKPARAVWLNRLNQPPPRHRDLLLAIEALGTVREETAVEKLRGLVRSAEEPFSYRLAAARALAAIRPSGLEADAAKLIAGGSSPGTSPRLLAVSLLRKHQGEEAVRLLKILATDGEPAVAVVALARLVEIDTRLVVPMAEQVLASRDAEVRSFGVEVLFRQPSAPHIRLLSDRLSDAHPDVRDRARRALRALAAKPELRGPVIEQAIRVLNAGDWRGQEQASYLLGHLGEKSIVNRLTQLLNSPRAEVAVASAWGIRVLAVPDTLPVALSFVKLRYEQWRFNHMPADLRDVPDDAVDRQLSQLIQFFGQAKYQPSDGILRAIVPRSQRTSGGEMRAAAAWTLGRLHESKPDDGLVNILEKPLIPVPNLPPDDERLRRTAATALGRMKVKHSLDVLRNAAGATPTTDVPTNACRWAIARITGDPLPPPGTVAAVQKDWFLVPTK